MKVVLDTNIILSAIFPTSPYQPILRAIANDVYDLHVTTAILLEYEEKSHQFLVQTPPCLF